jgi:hypothetical protein
MLTRRTLRTVEGVSKMRSWWNGLDEDQKNQWCEVLVDTNHLTDDLLDTVPTDERKPDGWVQVGNGTETEPSVSDAFADFLDARCGDLEPSEVPPE